MITMEWVRWIVFLVLALAYFTSLVLLIRGDIAIRRSLRRAAVHAHGLPPRELRGAEPSVIDPAIYAELRQTAEWWDREFARLDAECFEETPFDPAEHVGHEVQEWRTCDRGIAYIDLGWCLECPMPARRPRRAVVRSTQ